MNPTCCAASVAQSRALALKLESCRFIVGSNPFSLLTGKPG